MGTQGKSVVILGGGFAGLRIAHLLRRNGYRIILVEKSARWGGMVQTWSRELEGRRFDFDFGPHLFFEPYTAEYRALLGDHLLTLRDCFRMNTRGAVLAYPPRPRELLTRMNPLRVLAYLGDFVWCRLRARRAGPADENLEQHMTARFGRKLFDEFYAPYIEKCCGLPPREISTLWARERENVSGRSLADTLRRKVRAWLDPTYRAAIAKVNDPAARRISGWYPRHGAGELSETMLRELQGERLLPETVIERIATRGRRVEEVVARPAGGAPVSLRGDFYLSTIPLAQLVTLLAPSDPALAECVRHLRYRRVRLVNLAVRRPRVLDCLELFSMNREQIFKRIYEPKAMSPDMAPADMTSLCLEVCCDEGDAVARLGEQELVGRCVADLAGMRLLSGPAEVAGAWVVELPEAYPIYAQGFEEHHRALLEYIAGFENLLTCGRQGLFRYHAMTNEVMEMADDVLRFLEGNRDKRAADNRRSAWGQTFY